MSEKPNRSLPYEYPADDELAAVLSRWTVEDAPAALDERVLGAYRQRLRPLPLWRRWFAGSISVPVPVAALIVLAFVVGAIYLLRPASSPKGQDNQMTSAVAPPRVVEVPVVQERVITRKVYVARKPAGKLNERRRPAGDDPARVAATTGGEEKKGAYFTHADLSGFQPVRDVSIRVLKRSEDNEK